MQVYQSGKRLQDVQSHLLASFFSAHMTTEMTRVHFTLLKLPLTITHVVRHCFAYSALTVCLLAFLSFNNRFPRTVCLQKERLH